LYYKSLKVSPKRNSRKDSNATNKASFKLRFKTTLLVNSKKFKTIF